MRKRPFAAAPEPESPRPPSMPIADAYNLLGGELQLAGAIIEQNEIVPCAVHFGELNHDFS
jgi:hypothetical protein